MSNSSICSYRWSRWSRRGSSFCLRKSKGPWDKYKKMVSELKIFAENCCFDQFTDGMTDQQMALLDSRSISGWDVE